ncbi:hypothetical protein BGZ83_008155 [Gryganskiella cystojenkinii]|nr:hypothetical protein BGZ83_008155 [Gryganskiella cystojenkinii]
MMSTQTQQRSHPVYNNSDYTLASSSPPESPLPSSPEDVAISASSSTSSVDQLPPAFSAEGTTPAPCESHADMITHHAEIVVVDEDSFEDIHHPPPPSFNEISPPIYQTPPRTTSRTLIVNPHPLSNSFTASSIHHRLSGTYDDANDEDRNVRAVAEAVAAGEAAAAYEGRNEAIDLAPESPRPYEHVHFEPTFSSATTSIFTAPAPHAHHINRNEHHHMSSLFSFFAHSSIAYGEHHNTPHAKTMRIELAQKDVVLTTGSTTKLEGTLYLNLKHNTKVKSLQLEFSGRSSVTWVDENTYSPATRHTTEPHIEHTWSLISHQHKQPPTAMLAGQHAYPFSLELPDNLPESLTTTHGKVAYRVTATLIRPGLAFHNSSSVTAPVRILRRHPALGHGSRRYHRGGRAVNADEDKIKYKISLPQVRVPHSTKVPLQVAITSPNHATTVNVLQVALWEKVVYRTDGRERADMRLVKIQKSEGWPYIDRNGSRLESDSVTWNKVLLFDMPSMGPEMDQCNPSADNELMKVSHLMRFTILGTEEGGKRYRVESEVEMKVLAIEDQVHQADEEENGVDGNELPSYLTSFTTPRVSIDSEREIRERGGTADDDLLRALISTGIHLPTYAESEEDTNSQNASRSTSRAGSPERSNSMSSAGSNSSHLSETASVESESTVAPAHVPVQAPRAMIAGGAEVSIQSRIMTHVRSSSNPSHQVHAPTPLRA